jgi:SAM-dependent methyltransferase
MSADFSMRCPVCEGNIFSIFKKIFDDRYGEPNLYELTRCKNCCHIATAPRLSDADLPCLYRDYYPRKRTQADHVNQEAAKLQNIFSGFLRWWNGTDNQGQYSVRAGEIILDVGCGSGTSLLEARALGAMAFGIETDPNVRRLAETLGLTIHIGSLQDKPFPGQSFDLIVMNQVIEHLPDPDLALMILRERLTNKGRMVLVFPNTDSLWRRLSGSRWINWHIPYHLHHFNLQSFDAMAERCGLMIVRSRTITPNVWTLLQLRASLYAARLGVPSPIWVVKEIEGLPKAKNLKANPFRIFLNISVMSTFAVINRLVDAFGMGDSLMVELRRSDL